MKKELYRSKFEAYPFLRDELDDLRCDFEILTDEVASMVGYLKAIVKDEALQEELLFVCELIYHINPSLRTRTTVTQDELLQLEGMVERHREEVGHRCKRFVLPQGSKEASLSHVLRVKCKSVVRLLYRHHGQGHEVDPLLLDFTNLLSGYFFFLALKLNELARVEEIQHISRNGD